MLLFLLTLSLLLLSSLLIVAEQDKIKTPLSNHGLSFFILSWNGERQTERERRKINREKERMKVENLNQFFFFL